MAEFLYIDPLKQGLKRKKSYKEGITLFYGFLYIDPLKQGLKLNDFTYFLHQFSVFIHRSIKTRIETKYIPEI